MNLFTIFNNPEYFYKPALIFRKIRSLLLPKESEKILTELLWQQKIYINPQQHIGKSVAAKGIFDLALTECVFRILQPDDTSVDAGANIGYITNLMAARCGKNGKIMAFEPHPALFNDYLLPNIFLLKQSGFVKIESYQLAVSDEPGSGVLFIPRTFDKNNGIATLAHHEDYTDKIIVQKERLDKLIDTRQKIKLLKIDVEGCELQVLKGAEKLLKNSVIENIIYEDYQAMDGKIENYLLQYGYHVFEIRKTFNGVVLADEDKNTKPNPEPNYLATLNPGKMKQLFEQKGWNCLK